VARGGAGGGEHPRKGIRNDTKERLKIALNNVTHEEVQGEVYIVEDPVGNKILLTS
jgi:hypothetical protein